MATKEETSSSRMKESLQQFAIVAGGVFVLFLVHVATSGQMWLLLEHLRTPRLQLFTTLVLAVLLEGFPFLLLGACISGIIEVLVPEALIRKLFPGNRILAALAGSCLGVCFPVCSCGNIPVARRLIRKGVPLSGAVSYLLAAPIINPITIVSTVIAFPGNGQMVFLRVGLALTAAVAAGMVFGSPAGGDVLQDREAADSCWHTCGGVTDDEHGHECPGEHEGHEHHEDHEHHEEHGGQGVHAESRFMHVLHHAGEDFFLTGKYLVIGASVAALFQVFVARNAVGALAHNPVSAVLLLGGLAIAFCLCSFADAFVASTFTLFSSPAKAAFMVLGPMANVTVMFMYLCTFKRRYATRLIAWIISSVLLLSLLLEVFRRVL